MMARAAINFKHLRSRLRGQRVELGSSYRHQPADARRGAADGGSLENDGRSFDRIPPRYRPEALYAVLAMPSASAA